MLAGRRAFLLMAFDILEAHRMTMSSREGRRHVGPDALGLEPQAVVLLTSMPLC